MFDPHYSLLPGGSHSLFPVIALKTGIVHCGFSFHPISLCHAVLWQEKNLFITNYLLSINLFITIC